MHTHLAPVVEAAASRVVVAQDGRLVGDGHRVELPELYRPDALIEYLDAAELDEAIVSIPPPFFRQGLPAVEAARWVRAANDGLLRAIADHPRLSGLAYLPLEHPALAIAEYKRVRTDARWAGVAAGAGGASRSLADPELAPLWEALDRDARLLMLHPGSSPDERLEAFYLANLLGNPVETAVAAAQLVFGNLLARHPAMRVLLVHCGGCVPAVVGRWERGVETARPGVDTAIEPPRQAVRRFFVDCLAHDRAIVDVAIEVFGEDRIVLGSDWPFPMGTTDPRGLVAHRGEDFAQRVAVDNAAMALRAVRTPAAG